MADSRRDLLDAINDFLQDSIVLPPGEYNKKTLLPIVDMARKKQETKRARRPTKELSTGLYTKLCCLMVVSRNVFAVLVAACWI